MLRRHEVINQDTLEKLYEGDDEAVALQVLEDSRAGDVNAAYGSWVVEDE